MTAMGHEQVIASEPRWAPGLEGPGGSGDPSPMTAYGVVQAMGAVLDELDGDAALGGKRVVVDGVGHVGTHLARLLAEAGARVAVADVNRERVDGPVREIGAQPPSTQPALEGECGILAPCAVGGGREQKPDPRMPCPAGGG